MCFLRIPDKEDILVVVKKIFIEIVVKFFFIGFELSVDNSCTISIR